MTTLSAILFIVGLALAGADPIEAQPMSLWQLAINLTGLLMFGCSLYLAHKTKKETKTI
jgi:hypothetical protein